MYISARTLAIGRHIGRLHFPAIATTMARFCNL